MLLGSVTIAVCIAFVSGMRSRELHFRQGFSEQLLNQTGLVLVVTFGLQMTVHRGGLLENVNIAVV